MNTNHTNVTGPTNTMTKKDLLIILLILLRDPHASRSCSMIRSVSPSREPVMALAPYVGFCKPQKGVTDIAKNQQQTGGL